MKTEHTMMISTDREIPGMRWHSLAGSSKTGTRFYYELPVHVAAAYVAFGMYGAKVR